METARSPKFLGDPRSHLPCSQTSAGPPRQAIRSLRCCPCVFDRKDSRDSSFGAQSHGFCDRCLRFTALVTQGRARLASDCGPGFVGMDWLPSGSLRKVSAYTHPPFPSFAWRDKQNTSLWNAADFIAHLTQFIPPWGVRYIHYYGLYSSRCKARWPRLPHIARVAPGVEAVPRGADAGTGRRHGAHDGAARRLSLSMG